MIRKTRRLFALIAAGCLLGCESPTVKPSASRSSVSPPTEKAAAAPATAQSVSGAATTARAIQAAASPTRRPKAATIDELLLFFPSKYPDGNWRPNGLVFQDVWFQAQDGTRLHGWYCPCENPRAVVLYTHGNAGNLSHRSARMKYLQKELRVAALVFDYRGYGRSEGAATVEGVLQDARAARKCLAERTKVNERQIVLLGESLGGAVAVDLAGRDGARGLILESTFSSLKDVATHHYPGFAWLVPAGKLNSAARIAEYKGPLLQSHGDADQTIPFASGLKLFEAAAGAKQFVRIPAADHNDPQSADYFRRMDRFIRDLPAR